jgi:hypothetical protein
MPFPCVLETSYCARVAQVVPGEQATLVDQPETSKDLPAGGTGVRQAWASQGVMEPDGVNGPCYKLYCRCHDGVMPCGIVSSPLGIKFAKH